MTVLPGQQGLNPYKALSRHRGYILFLGRRVCMGAVDLSVSLAVFWTRRGCIMMSQLHLLCVHLFSSTVDRLSFPAEAANSHAPPSKKGWVPGGISN